MIARRVGTLAALGSMAASGWYFAIYLARWEWNRAVVAGIIFVAAEVGLLGVVLFDRLARMHRRLDELDRGQHPPQPSTPGHQATPRSLTRLHEAAPPARRPFAWLGDPRKDVSVFVPVLLGAGVLLSGVAWVVERIGRITAGPVLERRLARRLDSLALPPGGLLGDDPADPFWPAR